MRTEVSFATSADGTRIAWSRHGTGPPLVRVGTWLTHLDHDWASPVWRHWLEGLGRQFTVVRYDDGELSPEALEPMPPDGARPVVVEMREPRPHAHQRRASAVS